MTKDEAINHARYQMALWRREHRLFCRVQRAIQSIQLASALTAIGTLSKSMPDWANGPIGVVIALTVVADFVFRPADAAALARDHLRMWSELHTSISSTPESELEARISQAWQREGQAQDALRYVAYNDMLDERGYTEGHFTLNAWQRLLRFLS